MYKESNIVCGDIEVVTDVSTRSTSEENVPIHLANIGIKVSTAPLGKGGNRQTLVQAIGHFDTTNRATDKGI